jgi:hypothetical protein
MTFTVEENPDKYSEFGFIWLIIQDNQVIFDGLSCSYDLAETDAKNYIEEHQ